VGIDMKFEIVIKINYWCFWL